MREWILDAAGLQRRVRVMKRRDFLGYFAERLHIQSSLTEGPGDLILKPVRAASLLGLVLTNKLRRINWDGNSEVLVLELGVPDKNEQDTVARLKKDLALTDRASVVLKT